MRTTPIALLTTALLLAACGSPTQTPSPATTDGGTSPGASVPSTGGTVAPGGTEGPPTGTAPSGTAPTGTTPTETGAGTTPGAESPPAGETIAPPSDPPIESFAPRDIDVELEEVVRGLDQPVYLTHAGDGSGRLFIVEREGRVLVLEPDGSLRRQPLLDIRDRVDTEIERGLHAIAFHPDFETNGRFLVHYNNASGDTIVAEYRSEGGAPVDGDSDRVVMRVDQPFANHNGGWIGFGPDGYFYLALGDGGGNTPGDPFGNGQDRSDLLGNILRIDVDGERPYAIPPDNPFAGRGGGRRQNSPEIWHYGLRNPWRASFDRETGDLWIGDVGQDRFEEVNVAPAGRSGLNYGWSDMEGDRCHNRPACDPSDYVAPVVIYGTDTQDGCSVTGGYVYRGSEYPGLVGGYLYSDYCSGRIWGFDAAAALASGSTIGRRLLGTPLNIVSFGEDEAGELYVVDLGGTVHRVTARPRG